MFDLKKEVHQYCQKVVANRIRRRVQILELEDHLHCEIEKIVRSGIPAEEAFLRATMNLGGTTLLQHEYRKNMRQNLFAKIELMSRFTNWVERTLASRIQCRVAVAAMLALVAVFVLRMLPDTVSLQSASNLFEACCALMIDFWNLSESSK